MSNCRNPVIRDPNHEFTNDCAKPAGLKRLDKIPRTLPRRHIDTRCEPVLQDEAGFAILDEVDGSAIHDNLKGDTDC
jgi:hypothetical protein